VSPNGVDTDLFNPNIDGSSIRKKYGLEDSFVIGYSGGFNIYHGIDTLINASKMISEKIQNVKFFLIGDGEYRKHVDEFAEENGLKDKIIVTGLVPFKEVPAHLAACDVLVSPIRTTNNTTFFGSPIKTYEYLSMGKPIVATNIGILSKVYTDHVNALVMKENDPFSLTQKVIELFSNRQLADNLQKNARNFALNNCSWSKKYNLILEIYKSIKNN
jgi:glycosyltransferase involved in cell wall biosynthesis